MEDTGGGALFLTVEPVGAGTVDLEHLDACAAACPFPIHDRAEGGAWEGEPGEPGGTVVLWSQLSMLVDAGPFRNGSEVVAAAVRFLEEHREDLRAFAAHPSVAALRLRLPAGVGLARLPRWVAALAAEAGVVVTAG